MRIKDDYTKIIVDVFDTDLIILTDEAISILKEILDLFPNKYEFTTHDESYTKTNDFSHLPKIDEIVSANEKVCNNMKKHGFKVRKIKRYKFYRSSLMREAFKKKK